MDSKIVKTLRFIRIMDSRKNALDLMGVLKWFLILFSVGMAVANPDKLAEALPTITAVFGVGGV